MLLDFQYRHESFHTIFFGMSRKGLLPLYHTCEKAPIFVVNFSSSACNWWKSACISI